MPGFSRRKLNQQKILFCLLLSYFLPNWPEILLFFWFKHQIAKLFFSSLSYFSHLIGNEIWHATLYFHHHDSELLPFFMQTISCCSSILNSSTSEQLLLMTKVWVLWCQETFTGHSVHLWSKIISLDLKFQGLKGYASISCKAKLLNELTMKAEDKNVLFQ